MNAIDHTNFWNKYLASPPFSPPPQLDAIDPPYGGKALATQNHAMDPQERLHRVQLSIPIQSIVSLSRNYRNIRGRVRSSRWSLKQSRKGTVNRSDICIIAFANSFLCRIWYIMYGVSTMAISLLLCAFTVLILKIIQWAELLKKCKTVFTLIFSLM